MMSYRKSDVIKESCTVWELWQQKAWWPRRSRETTSRAPSVDARGKHKKSVIFLSQRDTEIIASLVTAGEDLKATQPQPRISRELVLAWNPSTASLDSLCFDQLYNTAAVCTGNLKVWNATFLDGLRRNWTATLRRSTWYAVQFTNCCNSNHVQCFHWWIFKKAGSKSHNHSLSLMFLNIIHVEIVFEVIVWRLAVVQRKQTFLGVNNGGKKNLASIMETKPLLRNEQHKAELHINQKSLCRAALLFVIFFRVQAVQLIEKEKKKKKSCFQTAWGCSFLGG